ncbi:hypothetical protein DFA_00918 [Cavenderia fasciculata]|uniref:Uncharacterized protein n=1 Tax=Cavenderia fasciculata TaxID=261658 RepID=F4PUH3_CACFS|nr:uncharacterized protein DFA_00918 [Cavenderia fasciculata]EGG21045.1 hypothetical protein DFA_00918 [Cavenderia fasciculata]|eukprot:XP_004358895.1 hypothetical protein DFA_00918 [Cavenderia fasciculata]
MSQDLMDVIMNMDARQVIELIEQTEQLKQQEQQEQQQQQQQLNNLTCDVKSQFSLSISTALISHLALRNSFYKGFQSSLVSSSQSSALSSSPCNSYSDALSQLLENSLIGKSLPSDNILLVQDNCNIESRVVPKKNPAVRSKSKKRAASLKVVVSYEFTDDELQGMKMVLLSGPDVVTENGIRTLWKLKLSGTLVRDDTSPIKWEHTTVVIASVYRDQSETYNIESQSANDGIKLNKVVGNNNNNNYPINGQTFKMILLAFDKLKGGLDLTHIPNCIVESNDIVYSTKTEYLPPRHFISHNRGSITRKIKCDRFKWGVNSNFSIGFRHSKTL